MSVSRFYQIAGALAVAVFFSAGTSWAQDTQAAPDAAAQDAAAQAQQPVIGEAVAATVNDSMISTYDVRQRMRLMIISSGQKVPASMMPQLQQQALKDLVDEKLKMQEAKRLEFKTDDSDVESEIGQIAAQGGVSVEQLGKALAQDGISIDALRQQVRTRVTWEHLVSARYGSRVRIDPTEIEQTLDRLRADSLKSQYLLSEICLPVDDPAHARDVFNVGMQMIEQMRKGVPFSVIARQFSACPSAANGGSMGWVRSGELPPELDAAVSQLDKGAVTRPIPSEGAFFILAMQDKRQAAVASDPKYTFVHVAARTDKMSEDQAREAIMAVKDSSICNSDTPSVDLGPGVFATEMEEMPITAIDVRFRPMFDGLERGAVADPVMIDGALQSVFLCSKDEGLGLPSREQIEDRIFSRELNLMSQRYLRDLQRDAAIDYRLSSGDQG